MPVAGIVRSVGDAVVVHADKSVSVVTAPRLKFDVTWKKAPKNFQEQNVKVQFMTDDHRLVVLDDGSSFVNVAFQEAKRVALEVVLGKASNDSQRNHLLKMLKQASTCYSAIDQRFFTDYQIPREDVVVALTFGF